MTVSLVSARLNAFYDTGTSVSRTLAGTINVDDLITVPNFARSAITGPSGYTESETSATTSVASQRASLYHKTAVAADASPNPAPLVQIDQASSGRMGIAYAIFRSTLGALTPGDTAISSVVTTATATGPTVTNATSYVAISVATNVYASGDQSDPVLASGTDAAWVHLNTGSGGSALNRVGYAYCLVPAGGAAPAIIWEADGTSSSNEWAVLTSTFLEVVASGVVKGVIFDCLLHDKVTPTPDTTGINYSWWDDPTADVEAVTPTATGTFAISSGQATIDLSADTSNAVAANGKLRFEKYNATSPELSLGGTVILPIVDTAA